MSRQNKVNTNNYTQNGRLTPDEMARERMNRQKPRLRQGSAEATARQAPGERESTRPRTVREESD
jgi:hypothetical protein